MTEKQRHILEQASFSNGGTNFISDISKVAMQDYPVLVVGLGGIGIDALLRIKCKVNEIFKTDIDPRTGKRKTVPDNIKFIAMDTDKTYFTNANGREGRTYRGFSVEPDEELNIGTDNLSAFIQCAKENNLTYVTDWLHPAVNTHDVSIGTNGDRQIGRLCLFRSFDKVFNKFKSVINSLTASSGANPNSKVYIYVVGGISGGTGSGIFIDIAYMIQQATKTALGMGKEDHIWDRLVLSGYFVTPDVNSKNYSYNYIFTNGYAAMKELDYLMGIEDRQETFNQSYGSVQIISKDNPYSMVNFVTSYLEDGTEVKDAYDTALQVISENIIFFIANNSEDFCIWSYENNIFQEIHNMMYDLYVRERLQPVSYRYGIIGSSGRILPVQDIMTCFAVKLLNRINEMWESHGEPTTAEVQMIVGPYYFAIDPATLTKKLLTGATYSFEDIKTDPLSYPNSTRDRLSDRDAPSSPDYPQMFQSLTAIVDSNVSNPAFMQGVKDNVLKWLKSFFENTAPVLFPDPLKSDQRPNYGPRFAYEVLVGAIGSKELNALSYCMQQSHLLMAGINDADTKVNNILQAAANDLRDLQHTLFGRTQKYKDYITKMETAYSLKLQSHINKRLIDVYQDIIERIIKEYGNMFGTICESLKVLREIFQENASIMGDLDRRKTVEGVAARWHAADYSTVNRMAERIMGENTLEVSVEYLYRVMWKHRDGWSAKDEKDYTVFEDMKDFIAGEFVEVLGLKIEDFLREAYSNDSCGQASFESYIQNIIDPDLTASAALMYKDRVGFKTVAGPLLPKRFFIQIPRNLPTTLKAVKNAPAHVRDWNHEVLDAANRSRIAYINVNYGMPLYSYNLMEKYEALYEDRIASAAGDPGVHLYQKGDVNWEELPALCPMGAWSEHYQNPREKERVERANAIFDKAVKYGIIRFDEVLNCHIAVFAGNVDIKGIMDNLPADKNGLKAAHNHLTQYLDVNTDLPGDAKYRADGYDRIPLQRSRELKSAKLWFASSFDLIHRVKAEVAKYEAIEEAVKEIKEKIAGFATFEQFVRALLTGVVIKKGSKYFYVPANEAVDEVELAADSQLTHKADPYIDIYELIFNKGKLLPEQFKQFVADVEQKTVAFENSDYDTVYVPAIEALAQEISAKLASVRSNADMYTDADKIIAFYEVILGYLESIK